MADTYWAIKRRDYPNHVLVHTVSWSRKGAWERFERNFRTMTHRQLLKEFKAVKVRVQEI